LGGGGDDASAGDGTMSSSEDDGGGRLTTWTLGAIKERNLALEGYCQTKGCGHFYVFNVDNLISGMGADYVVPEILAGIVCKECGGDLKFKLAMGSPEG
jgi:hypothetical protein